MTRYMQKTYRTFPGDVRPDTSDPGFLAGWILTNQGGEVLEIGGSGVNGTPVGNPDFCTDRFLGRHARLDGAASCIDVGDTSQDIKTMVIVCRPLTTTESVVDLDGSITVTIAAGTLNATGWASPTRYVNGLAETTVAAKQWQHLVITSDTPIDVDDLDLGRVGAAYFDGRIATISVYSDAKSAAWVAADYQRMARGGFAGAEGVHVSIANQTAGYVGGSLLEVESGTWAMIEDSAGRKVVDNVAVGDLTVRSPSLGGLPSANDAAFGTWDWWQYKPNAATLLVKPIGTDINPAANGYAVLHTAAEGIYLMHLGTGALIDGGTVSADAWHRITLVRRYNGRFELFVDGVTVGNATDTNVVTNTHSVISASDAVGCLIVWSDPAGASDFARYVGEYLPWS